MTALTDQIDNDLRDYNTPGNPGSGTYNFLMADLRDILNTIALGQYAITEVGNFLMAADVNAARTAIGLGTGSSPTFTSLTLSGGLTVDTNVFRVDNTNNRVGVGTAAPATVFDVVGAAAFSSTMSVTGAVTFAADLTVDTTTFKVDSTNNRVGIGTASPGVTFDVVGESRITANNATNGLRVVQTGVGNVVLFEDATSSDSSPWLIDQNGVVVHGHTATVTAEPSNVPKSQVHALGADAGYWATRWSADASPAYLRLGKSRGTAVGTRGTVSTNDQLGSVLFLGDDGAAFRMAGEIVVEADAAWGSSDAPGRMIFKTTSDGSATPSEALAILSNNFIAIGGDRDTGFFLPGANEIAFYAGGGEAMRLDEGGKLVVGHTDSLTSWTGTPRFQVVGNSNSNAQAGIWRNSDDTSAAIMSWMKSRGSASSPTIISSGDIIGTASFAGHDGSGYTRAAEIRVEADNTVSSGVVPGRIRLYTATTGGTLTEAMRLDSAQQVYFPQHATTATAANAVLATGSSPVGQLLRSTSSLRYKTDVQDLLDSDIDKLALMRPIVYRSTSKADDPSKTHLGFIAEELALIDPRLINWALIDDVLVPDGVQYERLTVLLVGAVKKLTNRVKELEGA